LHIIITEEPFIGLTFISKTAIEQVDGVFFNVLCRGDSFKREGGFEVCSPDEVQVLSGIAW